MSLTRWKLASTKKLRPEPEHLCEFLYAHHVDFRLAEHALPFRWQG